MDKISIADGAKLFRLNKRVQYVFRFDSILVHVDSKEHLVEFNS